jgi:hypothetical protein
MAKLPKAVLATKEELEQVDEKYRDLYTEKDGKFILDVDVIDDLPQVGGLKSALQKERDSVKQLKKDLQTQADKFKDLDPEKAREALKKLHELEDKDLLDAGKLDEVIAKRTERMQQDHQQQIQGFQQKLTTTETELGKSQRRLASLQVEAAITRALTSKTGKDLGIIPQAIPDVVRRAMDVFQLDDKTGQIIPHRSDGTILFGKDPAAPMPMDEWLSGLKPDCPHYFAPSGGAGSGNDGGAGAPKKKRSEMSPTEKAAYIGKYGQDAYLSLPV